MLFAHSRIKVIEAARDVGELGKLKQVNLDPLHLMGLTGRQRLDEKQDALKACEKELECAEVAESCKGCFEVDAVPPRRTQSRRWKGCRKSRYRSTAARPTRPM